MPKTTSNSLTKSNEKDNRFRARLMAQLLVIFIALSLLGIRIGLVLKSTRVTSTQITRTLTTIPFLVAFCLLVVLKYILFKTARDWILKYANYFDLVFALVFTAEWLVTLDGQLSRPKNQNDFCYSLLGYMTYGSFSWRTLLQILISQLWQIRIIAPTVAWIFVTQFAVRHDRSDELFILLYGIFQMCYIILIFYFDYKMSFTFTIGSIQQQQWLQLNEFILNNVPENIAIMDLNGECQFINENFRKLMNRRTQADEVKKFLRSIKDIQKQRPENDSDSDESKIDILHVERSNSSFTRQNSRFETQEPTSLEELVTVFGTFIRKGFIKERSLYSFNAKFKEDEEDTQERSFQIHTSFIHYQPYKYILLILRDTTHRDMVLSLKGDMKYKDHLLASVSHELRTPLNGNINMIEAALRSKDISDKIKETLLLPAVKSSKFLLYLVNDILDLYQIKAQKLRLVFQQCNLKETLANTLQLVELHAKKKGIELQTNIDPTIPDTFCTDHARLSQVILNLINNSIKFTQSGYVKLSAWPLIGTDIETDQINISIEDSGIGMSQADTCKLFKDFTHIDSKDRERLNPAGVGLGLKIANDLAKLLGPTGNAGIAVDSIVNKGSIFSFVIENKETGLESQLKAERKEENKEDPPSPLIPNEINFGTEASLQTKIAKFNSLKSLPRLITEAPSQTLFSICSCARVLVVDDDPFNIMAYEVILSSLGTKFESAYNGKSAIDKMLNKVRYPCCPNCHPYKVVFMDEEMPGMSGIATVEEIGRLQSQGLLPQMEIMGCTAHHDKEKIEEFLKAGITEYVSKPISFDTIKRILDKYDV